MLHLLRNFKTKQVLHSLITTPCECLKLLKCLCIDSVFNDMQAGLLFFISVFWGFFPLFSAIFTFPQERAMLIKERSVDMYRLSAYFVARNTSDLPLDLILPTFFMAIVYFMAGLKPNFTAFSLTMLAVFLSIWASQVRIDFISFYQLPGVFYDIFLPGNQFP